MPIAGRGAPEPTNRSPAPSWYSWGSMEIKISVLSSGEILLDGKAARLSAIQDALEKADRKEDFVLYYREGSGAEPPPQALRVMNLIVTQELPVSFSSRPDFSDYLDQFGQSHARPVPFEPPPHDPFEPRMPDVDLRPNAEDVFAEARRAASRENGEGGVVIVRPDRGLLVLPTPPASPRTAKLSEQLTTLIPMDRCCNIAAIGSTLFTMWHCDPLSGFPDWLVPGRPSSVGVRGTSVGVGRRLDG